ncbi:nucleotide sugar dehydrogenase [Myxococcota bacterium]|nr:nucleotide sugar dehydrogenase [Myxococcota bacterium]
MPFDGNRFTPDAWRIRKIGVIGPGIVGMPMAALLAAAARDGAFEPDARVVVVQRRSPTSGWKVDAINDGRSPIGGVEPDLERIIGACAAAGRLSASDDYGQLADCDLVLVCVQTDKDGLVPDYGPLDGALSLLASQLVRRPAGNVPVVAIESTLAPSSMTTVVREHFRRHGLEEGRDVLLGNSPNRVMPGRLIERVAAADKLVGGLSAETPVLIASVYRRIVTQGSLHPTTSMTAEVVKTLENAYRDVRIAFAAEVVRFCDARDVDFFALRDAVNARVARGDTASRDAAAVPVGALLVPTIGVGGHCLPKDGILLRWRYNARYPDRIARSLIHLSRVINDEAPEYGIALAERRFGPVAGRRVAVLGAAYRADSDDTRNAPALSLCARLRARGCDVVLHDPFVRPDDQNLLRTGLDAIYTQDLDAALAGAALAFVCQAHQPYRAGRASLFSGRVGGVVDGCNAFTAAEMSAAGVPYTGIGRGTAPPDAGLVESVTSAFRAMERGVARELRAVIDFLNAEHAEGFDRVDFEEVRRLAATCVTGCDIAEPGPIRGFFDTDAAPFHSTLAAVPAG